MHIGEQGHMFTTLKVFPLSGLLKGQYYGGSMGDIMIFGQNSLNLNFEHCVN